MSRRRAGFVVAALVLLALVWMLWPDGPDRGSWSRVQDERRVTRFAPGSDAESVRRTTPEALAELDPEDAATALYAEAAGMARIACEVPTALTGPRVRPPVQEPRWGARFTGVVPVGSGGASVVEAGTLYGSLPDGMLFWDDAQPGRVNPCRFEPAEVVEVRVEIPDAAQLLTVTASVCGAPAELEGNGLTARVVRGASCSVRASGSVDLLEFVSGEVLLDGTESESVTLELSPGLKNARILERHLDQELNRVEALQEALAAAPSGPVAEVLRTRLRRANEALEGVEASWEERDDRVLPHERE